MQTGWLSEKLNNRKVPRGTLRDYIGASLIGSDCWRQIYYDFNGADRDPVNPKLMRTFNIGSRLEGLVIKWLNECGLKIEIPNHSNNQLLFKSEKLDYFRGHCDALILEPRSILEIKTAKDSSYKIFVNKGCKDWSARYYAQLQSYMGMSGLDKATILVLNKDSSEVSDEVIEFDKEYYEALLIKVEVIFRSKSPPPKINNSPFWYQCKMCSFKGICHE